MLDADTLKKELPDFEELELFASRLSEPKTLSRNSMRSSYYHNGVRHGIDIISADERNTDIRIVFWKHGDDLSRQEIHTEYKKCHISCALIDMLRWIILYHKNMQSIATGRANPNSPWAR